MGCLQDTVFVVTCVFCVHRDGVLVAVWLVRWQVFFRELFGSGSTWLVCVFLVAVLRGLKPQTPGSAMEHIKEITSTLTPNNRPQA